MTCPGHPQASDARDPATAPRSPGAHLGAADPFNPQDLRSNHYALTVLTTTDAGSSYAVPLRIIVSESNKDLDLDRDLPGGLRHQKKSGP